MQNVNSNTALTNSHLDLEQINLNHDELSKKELEKLQNFNMELERNNSTNQTDNDSELLK